MNDFESAETSIDDLNATAYTIPTDLPEGDGTLKWDSTTIVLVRICGGGETGIGYTCAADATARFIENQLKNEIIGENLMAIEKCRGKMIRAVRNNGRAGISSMAISAVDIALWDLKAKILNLPLAQLLGQVRSSIPVYGSGGFTTYPIEQLQKQLSGWVSGGISRVKMKIGNDLQNNLKRVAAARSAIGPDAELFVDANSAFSRKTALQFMEKADRYQVSWMEQPLAPEDLEGLRMLRDRAPPQWEIADGEYGYDLPDFRRFLEAGSVDVMMADVTRCEGISGFLKVAALCEAFRIPLSSHCAPLLHVALGTALKPMRHLEYFHDHVRIEKLLFDAEYDPVDGNLSPNLAKNGLGFSFRESDAERYRVF